MPAAVVYSDMDDAAGVQGGIFDDLKFFIVQRVPQRSHYVSLVENNGGRVVKLEAQANYLIADHVRHDAPPGSLSYKFIENAVKEGSVPEDESKFLAGRPKSINPTTTTIASSSRKATRTPFTADDDKLLYKWVQKANNSGLALQGNKIYQILAVHNDRHTYQSWRDRYVKAISFRPPPGWEDYSDENLPSLTSSINDLASTALPRSTPVLRPSASPTKALPKARERFTAEDDEELIAWVGEAHSKGEPLLGNELYKKLAAKNPRHSYQSWRGHWVDLLQHIVDLDEQLPVEADISAAQTSPSPEPPSSRQPVKRAAFRIPPAALASAGSPVNDTPKSIAPRSVTTPDEPLSQSAQASSSRPTVASSKFATREMPHILSKSPSEPIASRPVATSKNQANTPVDRTHNMSSPVTSQQQQFQHSSQPHQPQSFSPVRSKSAEIEPEPPSYDDSKFTEEDYEFLLNCALDIQNVCVGRYQESWISLAKLYPKCTAIEWRAYYERRVLPIVLQKENDLDFLRGRGDGEWVRFWQNQGQPIKTLPHLDKSVAADKQKKTLAETAELEDETTPRASKAYTLDQDEDMTVTTESSIKRKAQGCGDVKAEPSKRRRTESPVTAPAILPPPSQQAPQAAADVNEVFSISDNAVSSLSILADEEEIAHEAEAAQQLRREMEETRDTRHQLTRANLARIQARNGFFEDGEKRGIDLEKDDEDDDQANFIEVLGSLLPLGLKERAMEAVEGRTQQADGEYDDDEDDGNVAIVQEQPMEERVYDPALLEDSPEPEPNSYQSSAEFLTKDTQIQLDPPETQPWEDSSAPSQPQQRFQQSTQAIYDAEAQPFDQDIAPPPSEFDDEEPAPYFNTDSQVLADEEVWPWVDSQIAAGFREEVVKESLRITSFNPKLAEIVLQARGGRVNLAGVWTEQEDEIAEGRDANAMRLIEKKHGIGSVIARVKFLAEWRHDQEIAWG